jgi:hypothetical protein
MERQFMLNEQARDRVPNSAANPLSTAFSAPKFRCRPARPDRTQAIDLKQIFGVERVPFGGWETFSPCRHGEAAGSAHAPEPAPGTLVIAELCRHVVG